MGQINNLIIIWKNFIYQDWTGIMDQAEVATSFLPEAMFDDNVYVASDDAEMIFIVDKIRPQIRAVDKLTYV